GLEQADRPVDRRLLALAPQQAGPRVDLLERGRVFVEPARVGRGEQRRVDDRHLLDAAHRAGELEALALGEIALPAALGLVGPRVEPARDVFRRVGRLAGVAENARRQHAGDRRLLDHLAAIAAVQAREHVANDAGLGDDPAQIRARAFLAG